MHWLFPTPLYEAQLIPPEHCHQSMLRLVKRFHRIYAPSKSSLGESLPSLTGDALTGAKADQFHQLRELEWLNSQLAIHLQLYLAEVCGNDHQEVLPYIQKSWPVVCESNRGQILPHTHRNAHISAVYYLQIDGIDKGGNIIFMPSETYFPRALPFPASSNSKIQAHNLMPRNGQLLIFPANLLHSVGPYTGNLARYSIAYDVLLISAQDRPSEMIMSHPSTWRAVAN